MSLTSETLTEKCNRSINVFVTRGRVFVALNGLKGAWKVASRGKAECKQVESGISEVWGRAEVVIWRR